MAEEHSAEQVLEKCIKDMGPELGPIYNELSDELIWLHAKWKQYRILFGHSEERVDLLNKASGYFFKIVQDALLDNVVLNVARLTDPVKSVGKDNLTLLRLPDLIQDDSLKKEVNALSQNALEISSFSRDWRNRRLAHNDLMLALNVGVKPLPGISREKIEKSLSAFRDVLNAISIKYWESTNFYEDLIVHGGDGQNVVRYIRAGIKAEEAKRERLRKGQPLPEDLIRDLEA